MEEPGRNVEHWLPAARSGSAEALGKALEACRGYLLMIAQRELDPHLQPKGGASDLVQETLVDALRGFSRFQGTGEDELRAWLRQLLLHNLVDFTRHYRNTNKRQIAREVALQTGNSANDQTSGLTASAPSPSRIAISQEHELIIQQAMTRLPEDYRRIILLRYQEERSFEEIGLLMNLTANAARKLWARAIKRLQQESEGPP